MTLVGNLGTSHYFPYVKQEYLAWETRRQRVVDTMVALDADIVCCEELNDFWAFFQVRLSNQPLDYLM